MSRLGLGGLKVEEDEVLGWRRVEVHCNSVMVYVNLGLSSENMVNVLGWMNVHDGHSSWSGLHDDLGGGQIGI